MDQAEELIVVSDLTLIATLMTLKQFPVSIDRHDAKRINFIFPATVRPYITQYWAKQLLVDPLELSNQLKNAKGRIWEAQAASKSEGGA